MSDLDPTDIGQKEIARLAREVLKVKPRPRLENEDPGTWQQVLVRLHGALKKLACLPADAIDLIQSTIKSGEALLRGAGELPDRIGRRIERLQIETDASEEASQAAIIRGDIQAPNLAEAIERIEFLILKYRAKGLVIELIEASPGVYEMIVVRPDLEQTALELADKERHLLTGDLSSSETSAYLAREAEVINRRIRSLSEAVWRGDMRLAQILCSEFYLSLECGKCDGLRDALHRLMNEIQMERLNPGRWSNSQKSAALERITKMMRDLT